MFTPNWAMLMAGSMDRKSAGSQVRRQSLNMMMISGVQTRAFAPALLGLECRLV
jgi:hypothetical protein